MTIFHWLQEYKPLEYIAISGDVSLAGTAEIIRNRSTANRRLILEASLVGRCGLLLYFSASPVFAYSVILGGLAFVIPNALFVWFSFGKTANSNSALTWFYVGEAIKIVTTIVIFAVSFLVIKPLNIGLMFVSYGVVLLVNLTGLALLMNK